MNDLRTDLVCELIDAQTELYTNFSAKSSNSEISGVKIRKILLDDAEEARKLGKSTGRYVTVECSVQEADGAKFTDEINAVAGVLREMLGGARRLFVAGLGNGSVTPDSLGPRAVAHILVSRHIRENRPDLFSRLSLGEVAALAPGVLGQTGVESADIIRAVSEVVRPDAVLLIDALAARAPERLCATVQITDTGLSPGSGLGNRRTLLSEQTLGLPVLAMGIPMMISSGAFRGEEGGLMVTPKEIDLLAGRCARLLGYAVNACMHHGMRVEDMDSLLA